MKQHSVRRIVLPGVICALLLAAASQRVLHGLQRGPAGGAHGLFHLRVPGGGSAHAPRPGAHGLLCGVSRCPPGAVYSVEQTSAGVRPHRPGGEPQAGAAGPFGVGSIFPFVFFLFFGFFGFFFEGKLSGTLMDERYRENQLRARTTANRIALTIIFLAVLLLGQGKIMGSLELTLVAFVIVVVLALALELFLSSYLLYRYDHDEPVDGDGE